ncbi:MAG TPA: hypothetical protein VER33_27860 [Polyangiaceae bacterium]|nr:hypothetical protein [Polyangiaceae bacterium]
MKRMNWSVSVALIVFSSGCALESGEREEAVGMQEGAIARTQGGVDAAVAATVDGNVAARTQGFTLSAAGGTVTAPKPPWPGNCDMLGDKHVSMSTTGPDGGTCTISGDTSNCRPSGDVCVCDLDNQLNTGDCKDNDSTDSVFDNIPETQGSGF